MKTILVLLLSALPAVAQVTVAGAYTFTGPIKTQTGAAGSVPGTCTQGQIYFASDATAGRNLYLCTATNTWTQMTGAGTGCVPAGSAGQMLSDDGAGGCASSATYTTSTIVRATAPGAGIARFAGSTQAVTSAELSGDATTSGSNAVTVAKVAGTAAATIKTRGIPFTLGDQFGSALTAGGANSTDFITVPFACTISAYNLLIDAADSTFRVKFWKIATGTAIPTSSNSISTSGLGVATATAIHSTTTSDFTTTTVTANDIMAMAISTANTVKMVQGVLQCDQ